VRPDWKGGFSLEVARECSAEFFRRNRKPVFLTAGHHGILLFTKKVCQHIPAVPVEGEIDIVGAGDSVMAGVVSALCSRAEPAEAALLGDIVASITIQQIGTTGTASRKQVRERFAHLENSLKTSIILQRSERLLRE
jgi:sugar/nucleoside kinase (ribokinase family)